MAAQSRVLALDDRLASTPQGGARLKVEVPMERPPEHDRPESAVSERRASVDRDGVRAIRVFLIGEVRVYCDGLAQLLSSQPGVQLVGTAAPTRDSIRQIATARPDVVLVDSATARRGDTVRLISATSSKSHVIAFAVREEEAEVLACAEAGVAGYVACDAFVQRAGVNPAQRQLRRACMLATAGCDPVPSNRGARARSGKCAIAAADAARARDPRADRRRPDEQGDREGALNRADDREEPRAPHPGRSSACLAARPLPRKYASWDTDQPASRRVVTKAYPIHGNPDRLGRKDRSLRFRLLALLLLPPRDQASSGRPGLPPRCTR